MSNPDELLDRLLGETPDVKVRGSEYERNGVVFAARPDARSVELKLGAEITEAALRTADTKQSVRGSEWVLIAPADWSSARDRLEAWYRMAWRHAGMAKR